MCDPAISHDRIRDDGALLPSGGRYLDSDGTHALVGEAWGEVLHARVSRDHPREARLLPQLSQSRLLERFAGVHETGGQLHRVLADWRPELLDNHQMRWPALLAHHAQHAHRCTPGRNQNPKAVASWHTDARRLTRTIGEGWVLPLSGGWAFHHLPSTRSLPLWWSRVRHLRHAQER